MDCVYSKLDSRPSIGHETEEARSYSDLESDDNRSRTVSSTEEVTHLTSTSGVAPIEAEQARTFDPWNGLSQWPKGPPQDPNHRVSDLDLLHHYITHTSKTLTATSNDSQKQEGWEVTIPRLAFKHEGVSHALRALSALHLVSEILQTGKSCTGDSGKEVAGILKSQAESQYGQALRLLGADVASFDSAKNDSILSASALLFVFNTAHEACVVAQEAKQEGCEVGEIAQDNDAVQESRLPSWLHFVMGIKTIRAPPVRKTKVDSDFDGVLEEDFVVVVPEDVAHLKETDPVFLARVGALHCHSVYSHRMFHEIARTRLAAFKSLYELLRNQRSRLEDAHSDSCCAALQKLIDTTGIIFNPKALGTDNPSTPRLYSRNPLRSIFSWVGTLDDEFFHLLEVGDLRALAVYAHFLTFLLTMDDLWFVGGMGRWGIERNTVAMYNKHEQHEKLNVRDSVLQTKFDWRTAMLWPSEMATLSMQAAH